jgi:hypothetical protein
MLAAILWAFHRGNEWLYSALEREDMRRQRLGIPSIFD